MKMLEITLRITVTPGRVRLALILFFLLAFPQVSSTFDEPVAWGLFPAPTAALPVTTVAADANLARDTGHVIIGSAAGNPQASNTNAGLAVKVGGGPGIHPASIVGRSGGHARLDINGTLRVNGCIFLKNGSTGSTGGPSGYGAGTYSTAMYWRCKYLVTP